MKPIIFVLAYSFHAWYDYIKKLSKHTKDKAMWQYWEHDSGEIYAVRASSPIDGQIQVLEADGPLCAGDITAQNIEFGYFSGMPSNATWVQQHAHEFATIDI